MLTVRTQTKFRPRGRTQPLPPHRVSKLDEARRWFEAATMIARASGSTEKASQVRGSHCVAVHVTDAVPRFKTPIVTCLLATVIEAELELLRLKSHLQYTLSCCLLRCSLSSVNHAVSLVELKFQRCVIESQSVSSCTRARAPGYCQ